MKPQFQHVLVVGFIFLLAITQPSGTNAAGECPRSTPDNEARKLLPCASAAQNANAAVSKRCCYQVNKLGQNTKCMCAVLLSNLAKRAGIDPRIAITIPKRCKLKRPVGYKCGVYTLP